MFQKKKTLFFEIHLQFSWSFYKLKKQTARVKGKISRTLFFIKVFKTLWVSKTIFVFLRLFFSTDASVVFFQISNFLNQPHFVNLKTSEAIYNFFCLWFQSKQGTRSCSISSTRTKTFTVWAPQLLSHQTSSDWSKSIKVWSIWSCLYPQQN